MTRRSLGDSGIATGLHAWNRWRERPGQQHIVDRGLGRRGGDQLQERRQPTGAGAPGRSPADGPSRPRTARGRAPAAIGACPRAPGRPRRVRRARVGSPRRCRWLGRDRLSGPLIGDDRPGDTPGTAGGCRSVGEVTRQLPLAKALARNRDGTPAPLASRPYLLL